MQQQQQQQNKLKGFMYGESTDEQWVPSQMASNAASHSVMISSCIWFQTTLLQLEIMQNRCKGDGWSAI